MAITNAQQYQQLVNKPANGKRPGYRGDKAYGSQSEQAKSFSKATSTKNLGAPTQTRDNSGNVESIGDAFRRSKKAFNTDVNTNVGITDLERLKDEGVPKINAPGFLSAGLNIAKPLRDIMLAKNIARYERTTTGPYTLQGYKDYMKSMRDRFTPDDDDNDSNQIFIPQYMITEAPSIMDQETEVEVEEDPFEISRRFRAEGGIMNTDVVGGEMDFDSARQMYGLGKLVKKITRSVKKIAKSPIGKAALLYTSAGALGNLAAGKGLGSMFSGFTSPSSFLGGASKIFTKGGLQNIASRVGLGSFENVGGNRIFQMSKLAPYAAIGGASAIAGMLTPQEEEEAQMISDETGIDIAEIRANPNKYLGRRFRAEGGSMDEPVAKKTMPLLDMNGQEMDLRAEGGFVPIGRMEKADDVPARLSKNEFVFTADAVRNAGDGDVDKGAEVMYNMMKNLESGGDVSEESQGLEGAREMFQTSQRLEEVI